MKSINLITILSNIWIFINQIHKMKNNTTTKTTKKIQKKEEIYKEQLKETHKLFHKCQESLIHQIVF